MTTADVVVDRANLSDVDGILKLGQANETEQGGALSGHLTREALEATIERIPSIVARHDGRLIGFLLTWEKTYVNLPILRAMLEAYRGNEDSYIYGPVCVDVTMRGRGLFVRMLAELRRLLPGREGLLFINPNNEPSLRAHRKIGVHKVANFTFAGTAFEVFTYQG